MPIEYGSYCTLCDQYFADCRERERHIQESSNHPKCEVCHQRFLNPDRLRKHLVLADSHYYCACCRKMFNTAAGLRVHLETDATHRNLSDDDEDVDDEGREEGWEDEEGLEKYPDERKPAYDGDESYRHFDAYDFADEDQLDLDAAPPPPGSVEACDEDDGDDDDYGDDDEENCFVCGGCEEESDSVGCTACCHLACLVCIKTAYLKNKCCPICDKPGLKLEEVRRVYLTA